MASAAELWVEGKDDQHVVWNLLEHHGVPEVFRVVDRKGIDNLLEALPIQLTKGSEVARVGIIVDADDDVAARWAAIRGILLRSGYRSIPGHPDPDGTVIRHEDLPWFGVWLMPANTGPGMIEDFAAAMIRESDALWAYSADVLDGLPDGHVRFSPRHRSKARIHTWLAWQEEPGSPIGQAIGKGDLDANAPDALRLVSWLRRLFVDE